MATTVPALEAAILEGRQRHEEYAAQELARVEREDAEAEAVLERERGSRRDRLADRVNQLPASTLLPVPTTSGGVVDQARAMDLANHIRGGMYDEGQLDAIEHNLNMLARAADPVPA